MQSALKRLIAILFLSIFLFNLYGYQLLIDYWQSKEDVVLSKKISSNLQETDLVSITIPAVLPPYSENLDKYEWVEGEVNLKGYIYKYIKRRIFKDSVEFVCIANTGKMHLENARENFFRLCNALQDSSEPKGTAGMQVKPVFFDYFCEAYEYAVAPEEESIDFFSPFYKDALPSEPNRSLEQPPEV